MPNTFVLKSFGLLHQRRRFFVSTVISRHERGGSYSRAYPDALCPALLSASPLLVLVGSPALLAVSNSDISVPGCSGWSVWKDSLCPAPSLSTSVLVNASLLPAHALYSSSVSYYPWRRKLVAL